MINGTTLIQAERNRQIEEEGFTFPHDAVAEDHAAGQMAKAAAYYALSGVLNEEEACMIPESMWPWDPKWFKPSPKDRVRELVKAGALIAAEIDRLQALELEWEEHYDNDDEPYWEAFSIYEEGFVYRVKKSDIPIGFIIDSDYEVMIKSDSGSVFKTISGAKERCKEIHKESIEAIGNEYKKEKEKDNGNTK
jgi:hypothetical protein